MLKYRGSFPEHSLEDIRGNFPYLQKRVYEVLCALSPEQLEFEMNLIPYPKSFCLTAVDQDTWEIVGHIMHQLLDADSLILTRDDVVVCYARFKELMFFSAAERQGIMMTTVTDSGIDRYYTFPTDANDSSTNSITNVFYGRRIRPSRKIR